MAREAHMAGPHIPSGSQYLLNSIANLHAELAMTLDQVLARDGRIAVLEAELAKLRPPAELPADAGENAAPVQRTGAGRNDDPV